MYSNRCPAEHFCYSCLLLPKEEMACHQMRGLVRKRLIVDYLLSLPNSQAPVDDRFLSAVRQASKDSHASLILWDALHDLQAEGYLVGDLDKSVGLVRHKVEEIQKKYQDHLAQIGHHVSLGRLTAEMTALTILPV